MDEISSGKNAKRQLQYAAGGDNNWPKRSKFVEGRMEQMAVNVLLKNQRAKGAIIGKQGNTIRKIRQECDVTFSITKIIGSNEQTAFVRGDCDGITRALIRAAELLQEAFEENVKSITLLVENRSMGALLGVRGQRVKEIRNRTRCKIYTSPQPIGSSSQNIVEISGQQFDEALTSVLEALSHKTIPTRIPYVPGETDGSRMEVGGPWSKRPIGGRFAGREGPWRGNPMDRAPSWARGEGLNEKPSRHIFGVDEQAEYQPHQARVGKRAAPSEELDMEQRVRQWRGKQLFKSQFLKPKESPEDDDISNMNMIPSNEQIREGGWKRQSPDLSSSKPQRIEGHNQNPEFLKQKSSQMEQDVGNQASTKRTVGFREERTIFIPIDKISAVIGKGSQTIKRIRQQSGAKIALEKERGEDFGDLKLIISGDRDSSGLAATMIHKFG